METVNGEGAEKKGGLVNVPPPSPLTGCYLLVVIGEPHTDEHKEIILQRIAKGLLSWDKNDCLVDLEKELNVITEQGLEGEEARYGERLIQFASENLVTEILIHPAVSTLSQCIRNLLSSFTRHRHIIHAGYTFQANGSWALQDGTFSLADFSEAFQEIEVQRVIKAYENGISIDIHCSTEGDWTKLPKESFTKACKVRVNPTDVLTTGSPSITNFINYVSPFLIPTTLECILESSDVVGNIRFSRPTLYVFPGGQGDAALFGINGFNMLLDGGFSRKACFWDFVRHLDRLDAVLMTRLNNSNVSGISSVLRRKKQDAVYPQIGHFFGNIHERKALLSPDGDKDKDPLIISLLDEGQDIISNLRHLNLTSQTCYRDSEPINLYHKVGHGTLNMYVLSPDKNSREVREFLQRWNQSDQKLFANPINRGRELAFPLQNLVSVCALLVWQPANPNDTITRILYPGSSPQKKIFEGLDRLKALDFIKHPVCSEKSLAPVKKTKDVILDKNISAKLPEKKEKVTLENKLIENGFKNGVISNGDAAIKEKIVKKSDSTESEKSIKKKSVDESKIIIENGDKPKPKPQKSESKPPKPRSDSQHRRKVDKKASPTTPKKTADTNKSEAEAVEKKTISKPSPSATPAKSTKDANNRKVIESKRGVAPRKEAAKPPAESKPKVERKPISRRPKAPKTPISPVKKMTNGVQKPDSLSKKAKLDKEGTTDSSTVSTPSADQDSVMKKDISKLTPEEIQQIKAQELADLKEEQEVAKEIEAVFRKSGDMDSLDLDEDARKVQDISIEDKEEYLIIEKEEIEHDSLEVKEEETQKLARDSEESEKQRKLSAEGSVSDALGKDKEIELIEEKPKDVLDEEKQEEEETTPKTAEKEVKDDIKEPTIIDEKEAEKKLPTNDKEDIEEVKEVLESQPDEKVSANVESGATTTAPTLPEDERIPLDDIKEDNGQVIIEEKHVKEDTKEKEHVPVIQLVPSAPKPSETPTTTPGKLPPVVGIRLDKQSHIRDIVKTPDEVADLPVHEEVDFNEFEDDKKSNEVQDESPKKTNEPVTNDIPDTAGQHTAEEKDGGMVNGIEDEAKGQLNGVLDDVDHVDGVKKEHLIDEKAEDDKAEEKSDVLEKAELETKEKIDTDHGEEAKDVDEDDEWVVVEKDHEDLKDALEKKPVDNQLEKKETAEVSKESKEDDKQHHDKSEEKDLIKGKNEKPDPKAKQDEELQKENTDEASKIKDDVAEVRKEEEVLKDVIKGINEIEEETVKEAKHEEVPAQKPEETSKTRVEEVQIEQKQDNLTETAIDNKEIEEKSDIQVKQVEDQIQTTKIDEASMTKDKEIALKEVEKDEEKLKELGEKHDKDESPKEEVKKDDDKDKKVEDIKEDKVIEEKASDIPSVDAVKTELVKETEQKITEIKEDKQHLEKLDDKLQELKDAVSLTTTETTTVDDKDSLHKIEEIKPTDEKKSDVKELEKIEEKLQELKKHTVDQVVHEQVKVVEHAESVVLPDSSPDEELDAQKYLKEIDKHELGRKSPKEREEDVQKIVASVAEVLKSEAALEELELEGKIPFYTTTELRETHITTVDSPIIESRVINSEVIPSIPEEVELDIDSKRTSLLAKSQQLLEDSSKIISDIKGKADDSTVLELSKDIPEPNEVKESLTSLKETMHVSDVKNVLLEDSFKTDSKLADEISNQKELESATKISDEFIEKLSEDVATEIIQLIDEQISDIKQSDSDKKTEPTKIEEKEAKDATEAGKEVPTKEYVKTTSVDTSIAKEIKDVEIPITDKSVDKEDIKEAMEEIDTVHRMLVTASSEDGGEETIICPEGTITFSKSTESSGRSSPEAKQLSQKSSIVDSISDSLATVKQVQESMKEETKTADLKDTSTALDNVKDEKESVLLDKVEDVKKQTEDAIVDSIDTVVEKKEEISQELSNVIEKLTEEVATDIMQIIDNVLGKDSEKESPAISGKSTPEPTKLDDSKEVCTPLLSGKSSPDLHQTREGAADKIATSKDVSPAISGKSTPELDKTQLEKMDTATDLTQDTKKESGTVSEKSEVTTVISGKTTPDISKEVTPILSGKVTPELTKDHVDASTGEVPKEETPELDKKHTDTSGKIAIELDKEDIKPEQQEESKEHGVVSESKLEMTKEISPAVSGKSSPDLDKIPKSSEEKGEYKEIADKSLKSDSDASHDKEHHNLLRDDMLETPKDGSAALSGKSTPDVEKLSKLDQVLEHKDDKEKHSLLKEDMLDTPKDSSPAVSGKSTPDLEKRSKLDQDKLDSKHKDDKEKHSLLREDMLDTPKDSSPALSGKSTPDLDKHSKLDQDKLDSKHKDDKEKHSLLREDMLDTPKDSSPALSGKSTPDLDKHSKLDQDKLDSKHKDYKEKHSLLREDMLDTPKDRSPALSGKSTPDLDKHSKQDQDLLDSKHKDDKEKHSLPREDILDTPKDSSPAISGKSTPDLEKPFKLDQDKLDSKHKDLSGKSTPDLHKEQHLDTSKDAFDQKVDQESSSLVTNTESLKNVLDDKKLATDPHKDEFVVDQSTEHTKLDISKDVPTPILSGKSTPDLPKTNALDNLDTPKQASPAVSGKSTPDISKETKLTEDKLKEDRHKLSGKSSPELEDKLDAKHSKDETNILEKDKSKVLTEDKLEISDLVTDAEKTLDATDASPALSGKSTPDIHKTHEEDLEAREIPKDKSEEQHSILAETELDSAKDTAVSTEKPSHDLDKTESKEHTISTKSEANTEHSEDIVKSDKTIPDKAESAADSKLAPSKESSPILSGKTTPDIEHSSKLDITEHKDVAVTEDSKKNVDSKELSSDELISKPTDVILETNLDKTIGQKQVEIIEAKSESLTFEKSGISTVKDIIQAEPKIEDVKELVEKDFKLDEDIMKKEEKQLEEKAKHIEETVEDLENLSKSLSFEKEITKKEEKILEEKAVHILESFDDVKKLSESITFEKCKSPEKEIGEHVQKEDKALEEKEIMKDTEKKLEEKAEHIEETLEEVEKLSKTIRFEKCKSQEEVEKEAIEKEEKELEKKAEHIAETFEDVNKLAQTISFDKCKVLEEQKEEKHSQEVSEKSIQSKLEELKDVIHTVAEKIDLQISETAKKAEEVVEKTTDAASQSLGAIKSEILDNKLLESKDHIKEEKKEEVEAGDQEKSDAPEKSSKDKASPKLESDVKDIITTATKDINLESTSTEIKDIKIEENTQPPIEFKAETSTFTNIFDEVSSEASRESVKAEIKDIVTEDEKCDKESMEKTKSDLAPSHDEQKKLSISEITLQPDQSCPKNASQMFLESERSVITHKDDTDAKMFRVPTPEIKETLVSDTQPGPSTVKLSSGGTSGKSTPDVTENVEKQPKSLTSGKETPPTVPVSPIGKESDSAMASSVDPELLESDDEDLSTKSQVAQSQSDLEPSEEELLKKSTTKIDPMSMSFYGELPDGDELDGAEYPTYLYEITKAKYASLEDEADSVLKKEEDSVPMQKEDNLMTASFIGELPSIKADGETKQDSGKKTDDTKKDEASGSSSKDPIESWGKPLGLPAPSYLYEITKAKYTKCEEEKVEPLQDLMTMSFYGELPEDDPISSWGKPLGLPSPAPPLQSNGTPKKERKLPPNVSAKNKLNDDKKRADSPSKNKNKKVNPIFVDLTYVPHHGNAYYSYVDFFKRIRARYYVFSGIEPSRQVYDALLEAKQTWEEKDLEVTIIPTYDTDILGYWVAENEELLTKYKIDLSPSASRCTINLQDHETSCSAYRLEF